jgi:hypothetical protein
MQSLLFKRTELLDLPGHNSAVRYLRVWDVWSKLLQILLLWMVASLVTGMVVQSFDKDFYGLVFVIVGACFLYANLRIFDVLTPQGVGGALSALGLAGGAAYYFYHKTGDVEGAALMGKMLAGLGIGLAIAVGVLVMEVAVILVGIVCACVNWLPALVARQVFNLCFPAWKNVAYLGPDGYERLSPAFLRQPRSFVINKKLRRNGQAANVLGIPLFTLEELNDARHVGRIWQQWIDAPQADMSAALTGAAVGAGGLVLMDAAEMRNMMPDVNPATGLPMIDGIGGIDLAGNHYGFNDSTGAAMDMHTAHDV